MSGPRWNLSTLEKVKDRIIEYLAVGGDYRGDPQSALLEVLDPEQNHIFHDHYLDVSFDLSNVLIVRTTNQLDTISGLLRDRMGIIQLPGYTEFGKLQIANRYLLQKQCEANVTNDLSAYHRTNSSQTRPSAVAGKNVVRC